MIEVFIPSQIEFQRYKTECKNLYESVQDKIKDTNSFELITKNTFFFLFTYNKTLIGSIYYFVDEYGRLMLNAFSKRKMHRLNIECLKMSLKWFKGNIYAEAQNRASALCLIRCGFRRLEGKLFVLEG